MTRILKAMKAWKSCGLLIALLLLAGLPGCTDRRAAQPEEMNCVAAYLSHAEQQFETEQQRGEIQRALEDMLEKSPEQIRVSRYANYEGTPNSWTAVQLLHHYFVPRHDTLGEDCFYRGVAASEARQAIRRQLERLLISAATK